MSHIKGVGVAEGLQSVFSPLDAMVSYTLLVVKTRSRTALFFCEQWLPRPVWVWRRSVPGAQRSLSAGDSARPETVWALTGPSPPADKYQTWTVSPSKIMKILQLHFNPISSFRSQFCSQWLNLHVWSLMLQTRGFLRSACVCAAAAALPGLRSCCGRKPLENVQTLHHSWVVWADHAPPHLTHRLNRSVRETNVVWALWWMCSDVGVTAPGYAQLLSQTLIFFLESIIDPFQFLYVLL